MVQKILTRTAQAGYKGRSREGRSPHRRVVELHEFLNSRLKGSPRASGLSDLDAGILVGTLNKFLGPRAGIIFIHPTDPPRLKENDLEGCPICGGRRVKGTGK